MLVWRAAVGLLDLAVCAASAGSSTLTAGLSWTWAGYLRDWDRSLRSGNYPEATRYNYLLAVVQLGRYVGEYSPNPDADAAADGPAEVIRAHVEAFQAWMIETRSAYTALNKHKGLRKLGRNLRAEFRRLVAADRAVEGGGCRQPAARTWALPGLVDWTS